MYPPTDPGCTYVLPVGVCEIYIPRPSLNFPLVPDVPELLDFSIAYPTGRATSVREPKGWPSTVDDDLNGIARATPLLPYISYLSPSLQQLLSHGKQSVL